MRARTDGLRGRVGGRLRGYRPEAVPIREDDPRVVRLAAWPRPRCPYVLGRVRSITMGKKDTIDAPGQKRDELKPGPRPEPGRCKHRAKKTVTRRISCPHCLALRCTAC